MSMALAEFTEKLVSVSDFGQGKAGKIFNDVYENDNEYVVLKNNQPTAVVVSVKEYKETQEKVSKLEKLLEMVENYRLLGIAKDREDSESSDFMEFLKEEGLDLEELEALSDKVEFE